MSEGIYQVKVQVNGHFVPFYQYDNPDNAKVSVISFLKPNKMLSTTCGAYFSGNKVQSITPC